ncbi:amidohydrolase [Actinocatenispora rupis]|uniref:Peptidase M20 domain-containing protein 2 n=1 Tax=Actinocatenispora rupis TaxID=519421 RepID=A0A8J3NFB0_9ACTN|nr:amidohydrolase [Actinocatenispora rupis]GID14690.1 amidohydrolase [Actinocatenispora rupis]
MSVDMTAAYRAIDGALAAHRDELTALSLDLHAHPELAMAEHRSAGLLTDMLRRNGFRVECGIAGLPTAFRAEYGTGTPRVAFLCEYDALPEIGHGCGHNLIAAGGVGAALALAGTGLAGTVCVIGTPGEEGAGGKILELDRGVFDDVDAALMFHPGDRTLPIRHATAAQKLVVEYHGVAAHAAGSPADGRSALAGLIQLFVAVDAMRQFVPETVRLHGIITHGGTAANVVPEYARGEFQVRDLTRESVGELVSRFRAAAQGTAAATGTTVEITPGLLYAERKNNHPLAFRVADHLRTAGIDVETPVLRGGTGSSDIGNVSLALPTIHPYLAVLPRGTATHSREMTRLVATPEAHEATWTMAGALARTGADLLADAEFRDAVRDDFVQCPPDYPA